MNLLVLIQYDSGIIVNALLCVVMCAQCAQARMIVEEVAAFGISSFAIHSKGVSSKFCSQFSM